MRSTQAVRRAIRNNPYVYIGAIAMPKVRIMTSDDVKNPMCFSGNIDTATLVEFDYLPRIGESVYWGGDLFYKVVAIYHEPIDNAESRKHQPWSTTIILKSPV